jgi:hypothetical protein
MFYVLKMLKATKSFDFVAFSFWGNERGSNLRNVVNHINYRKILRGPLARHSPINDL